MIAFKYANIGTVFTQLIILNNSSCCIFCRNPGTLLWDLWSSCRWTCS